MSVVLAAAAVTALAAVDAAASSRPAVAAGSQTITPAGVGQVKLGETYAQLRTKRLVGTIHKGCELAGPQARSANLKSPLKGGVDFTMSSPRKVVDISLRGGATARGVGIGSKIADIRAAFPKAKVDHTTDAMFGLTLVRIPKKGGGKLQFGVGTKTHKVTLIGIPFIAFCE